MLRCGETRRNDSGETDEQGNTGRARNRVNRRSGERLGVDHRMTARHVAEWASRGHFDGAGSVRGTAGAMQRLAAQCCRADCPHQTGEKARSLHGAALSRIRWKTCSKWSARARIASRSDFQRVLVPRRMNSPHAVELTSFVLLGIARSRISKEVRQVAKPATSSQSKMCAAELSSI